MLSYRRSGGTGKPLLLIHGNLGWSGYWEPQWSWWSDFRDVVALDLPGFGASSGVSMPAALEDLADVIIELMVSLGCTEYDIVGHSVGGMVAQEVALRRPDAVSRIVLYGTRLTGLALNRFERTEDTARRIRSDGIAAAASRILTTWFTDGSENLWYQRCLGQAKSVSPDVVLELFAAVAPWTSSGRLGDLRAACLVTCGSRDKSAPVVDAVSLWQAIPGAELCVIPNAAHAAHLERPSVFTQVTCEFLRKEC